VAASSASDAEQIIFGTWLTQGASAIVRVAPCGDGLACGTITWLWEPIDPSGAPVLDRQNPDAGLRARPLLGTRILSGFRPSGEDRWTGGQIYNPEDGRAYSATLIHRNADTLVVEGCVLMFCRVQVWRRVSSVCDEPR
jgi:uncharacterized protein (DUF2147 family)